MNNSNPYFNYRLQTALDKINFIETACFNNHVNIINSFCLYYINATFKVCSMYFSNENDMSLNKLQLMDFFS